MNLAINPKTSAMDPQMASPTKPSAADVHVIGVGSPLVDILTHVSDDFLATVPGAKGGMELVDHTHIDQILRGHDRQLHQTSGGSAANTIVGLAKLGIRCTFLGKLGADHLGRYYASAFETVGISTRRLKYCDRTATGRCLSMITPDAQRTCRTYLGAAMNLSPDEVTVDDFHTCTHAHIEGYKLFNRDLARRILHCAKEASCSISLDLASLEVVQANQDILDDLLHDYVDFVFANEDESKAYSGSDDPVYALDRLGELCDHVAIKLGAAGAYLKSGDEVVRVDAETVAAVDTTGAGDLWAAGYLYAHFHGLNLEAHGRIGSILGASVVQVVGANIPDPVWESVRQRIHQVKAA